MNTLRRRSLVFLISDFICAPGWEKALSSLSQRHEVVVIRLWDSSELEIPDVGSIIMEDAETGDQLYVDTHDRQFRQAFNQLARQRLEHLEITFKRTGVDVLHLSTGEDLVRAVVRFATLRQQRYR
jgi:uncharacterized protein (DUF58 family)